VNRLPTWVRQHIVGLLALIVFTVICGIVYPVVMTGIAQVAFRGHADGSLVSSNGRVVGSSVVCQQFVDAEGNPLGVAPATAPRAGLRNDGGGVLRGGRLHLRLLTRHVRTVLRPS